MTLPVSPTLMEVRAEVGIRLSMGYEVADFVTVNPTIDAWIRQAARTLAIEKYWVQHYMSADLTLEDGVHVYDIPDGIDVGRIGDVVVINNDGRLFELTPRVEIQERNQWEGEDRKSRPRVYGFLNQQLELYPAPDTSEYPTLRFYGWLRVPEPRANHDRIPIDKEALVQRAVLLAKEEMGAPDANIANLRHVQYLRDLSAMQSDGSGFVIGGHRSTKFPRSTHRNLSPNDEYRNHWWWQTYTPIP